MVSGSLALLYFLLGFHGVLRHCGPGGSAGLDALGYWRLCKPGGPSGLEALQA